MELLDMALRVATLVIALGSTGVTIALYRASARRKELDALGERIEAVAGDLAAHKDAGQNSRAELGQRLSHVETALGQLPDKDAMHKLDIAVTEIRGAINTQGETLKGVAATAHRVENFLFDAARENKQ